MKKRHVKIFTWRFFCSSKQVETDKTNSTQRKKNANSVVSANFQSCAQAVLT
jgi:hypothetical protein